MHNIYRSRLHNATAHIYVHTYVYGNDFLKIYCAQTALTLFGDNNSQRFRNITLPALNPRVSAYALWFVLPGLFSNPFTLAFAILFCHIYVVGSPPTEQPPTRPSVSPSVRSCAIYSLDSRLRQHFSTNIRYTQPSSNDSRIWLCVRQILKTNTCSRVCVCVCVCIVCWGIYR